MGFIATAGLCCAHGEMFSCPLLITTAFADILPDHFGTLFSKLAGWPEELVGFAVCLS
jgi:hypothetical protein